MNEKYKIIHSTKLTIMSTKYTLKNTYPPFSRPSRKDNILDRAVPARGSDLSIVGKAGISVKIYCIKYAHQVRAIMGSREM